MLVYSSLARFDRYDEYGSDKYMYTSFMDLLLQRRSCKNYKNYLQLQELPKLSIARYLSKIRQAPARQTRYCPSFKVCTSTNAQWVECL